MKTRLLQKTNRNGVQINILIIQGCIVTVLSSLYIFMKDVSVAFFLLSALTIGLYLIMYMMMYAAAIRLRYTQPGLQRDYRVPGGNAGMWAVGGQTFSPPYTEGVLIHRGAEISGEGL